MPKVVDAERRRREVAEAVWRVIRRDGLEHASVRNVAREAGLSMGSLRHYFASQGELMTFALRMVIERIERRVAALDAGPDPRRRAELVLAELLPLDADRRAENEVWLAFTARAMVDPELRALREEGHDTLLAGCRRIVRDLLPAGTPGEDVEVEAQRLHALVDGLAVHAAMRPDLHTPERLAALVSRHLDRLR
ncbi:TetR family transcriptional regulator C-terminal domain-containing protein [Actinomadura sp. NPDC047616]|uniref:TetR/AcrR family transcriptional regulator n=1 Tax=Actinomadura sp. NPDC047616 TaxID=3155914 RepID=UPI0033F25F65